MNRHFWNKTMWGLLLIGMGVLFLLRQTGIIDIDLGSLIAVFWPAILIFIGLKGMLIQSKMGHGWGGSWNAFIALLGIYFLLRNLDVVFIRSVDIWQFIVPIFLIAIGFGMITRGSRYEERRADAKEEYRHERERRRQERNEERARRHEERAKRHEDTISYKHKKRSGMNASNSAEPSQHPEYMEEEPVFDAEYARKIEQDLDKVFHERFGQKLDDDPFPLVSEAERKKNGTRTGDKAGPGGPAASSQEPQPDASAFGGDAFGAGTDHGASWHAGWQYDHQEQRRPVERTSFIGDVHLGQDYWQLEPTNISHFIGDTVIDLTKANIPLGETKLTVSAFIGDVKVFVPNDIQVEVSVSASAFICDMKVMDRHESGMFRNMKYDSRYYSEADKKIHLTLNMFIGDVLVKRVG